MRKIDTTGAPTAIGPYSQAIQAGDYLFSSGQIPINPATGNIAQGDVKEQTKQVLNNIRAILKEAGAKLSDVVKTTVFLKDLKDFSKVNEIYSEYFNEPYPARSSIEAARLPKDVLVEIEFIAVVKI